MDRFTNGELDVLLWLIATSKGEIKPAPIEFIRWMDSAEQKLEEQRKAQL